MKDQRQAETKSKCCVLSFKVWVGEFPSCDWIKFQNPALLLPTLGIYPPLFSPCATSDFCCLYILYCVRAELKIRPIHPRTVASGRKSVVAHLAPTIQRESMPSVEELACVATLHNYSELDRVYHFQCSLNSCGFRSIAFRLYVDTLNEKWCSTCM